ncbi:MAG TPA: hypothetical protein VNO52_02835 [Methylomirabilota bacterium]|nr:hypothetical protein [Methylomirabilota bacterium]
MDRHRATPSPINSASPRVVWLAGHPAEVRRSSPAVTAVVPSGEPISCATGAASVAS